jgi:5'-methylthioadenosine phosphorylase
MSEIKIGLIGGSGLGQALAAQTAGVRHDVQTPFGRPSDAIIESTWANVPVLMLNRHGPGHLLNPSQVPYRANFFALKALGCTHVIASGAVGSLREEFKPRHLVIPDQVIDKTFRRAATFYERAAVHVELAEPFCPVLRQILIEAGAEASGLTVAGPGNAAIAGSSAREPQTLNPEPSAARVEPSVVHDRGCYVAMEGPAFSTRAESLMHRLWGGDLVGMTAMPEARLAREAEMAYALVALVTDYDCWKPHDGPKEKPDPFALLNEIIGNLEATTRNAIDLMRKAVELIAHKPAEQLESPAHHALRLGIWSDKARIDPEEVKRLAPLWMKYF